MHEELLAKRSHQIRGMFGRIAHRYDLLNRTLSLGQDVLWRRRLARRLRQASAQKVVDVCTGTGDVALGLPGGTEALASDFCLPMLVRARNKGRALGRTLQVFAADALRLPLPDGCADAVTVAFGIRNFEDLQAGLRELVRILRPGGLLLVLEFSQPQGPLAPLLRWWVRIVPPLVGRLISGDREAYSYLPQSVATFPGQAELCAMLRSMGLDRVRAENLTGGVATLYEGTRPGGTNR